MLPPKIMDEFRAVQRQCLKVMRDAGGDDAALAFAHVMIEIGALALRDLQGPQAAVETLYAAGDTVLQPLLPQDTPICSTLKKKG